MLPACEWQHITFTMPDTLWPAFQSHRGLLNHLFSCASQALIVWAKKLGLEIGIFSALHTYSRRLNWHPHIHLSVTRGGLCQQHNVWRSIFFKKKVAKRYWRLAVITLLRHSYGQLDLSGPAYAHIRDYRKWCQFLESQLQRRWKVHFAKKTKHFRQTVNYLGRYLKRPPIAASRLRHYSGGTITFRYLDHRTHRHKSLVLSQEEMIRRYISHIPSRHFKMIRYAGFLSNRKRGQLLPAVYGALGMEAKKRPIKPGFASLMKGFTNVNPYECILCGGRLVFDSVEAGYRAEELMQHRRSKLEKERWLLGAH